MFRRPIRGPAGGGAEGASVSATPVTILGSGVKLWVRSDLGVTIATGVSIWADQSGNGNDFAQATGGNQPAYTAGGPNGRPSILFNGSAGYLDSALTLPTPGTTPTYYWIIGRQVTWTVNERIIGSADDTVGDLVLLNSTAGSPAFSQYNGAAVNVNTNWTLNTYKRVEALFTGSTGDYSKVGSAAAVTGGNAGNTAPGAGVRLGRNGGAGTLYANIEICEVIVYTGAAPTAGQRAALDAYCTGLYGAGLT